MHPSFHVFARDYVHGIIHHFIHTDNDSKAEQLRHLRSSVEL